MDKIYHGCNKTQSPFAEHEHTFWVYPPTVKLENKWDTHLSPNKYCNNHKDFGYSKYNPSLKECVCLGHTCSEDFIEAQKEWKSMNWNLHVVGLREIIETTEKKKVEEITIEQRLERLESLLIKQETKPISNTNMYESVFVLLLVIVLYCYYGRYVPPSKELVISSRELEL